MSKLATGYTSSNDMLQIIGDSIILASIQFSIGSVEMSSKFSVRNFGTDINTLQSAASALVDYMRIAILWTLCVSVLMYLSFGFIGGLYTLIANILVVSWIYFSYINSFKFVCEKHNLPFPDVSIF